MSAPAPPRERAAVAALFDASAGLSADGTQITGSPLDMDGFREEFKAKKERNARLGVERREQAEHLGRDIARRGCLVCIITGHC